MNAPIASSRLNPVYLNRLKLTTFRNYETLSIELDRRHVILTGENGAGKTNLLEAVSYLSPGRGLRRAPYDQVGHQKGSGAWSVFFDLEGASGQVGVGTGLIETATGVENQRKVRINGSAARTSDALLEHARVAWLTPAMDGLFTGPASDRRKFVDRMVLAIDPLHGRRVTDFEKAMRSRNRLLSEDDPNGGWLDAVETQMAELGAAIAAARVELLSLMVEVIIRNNDPASPFPDAMLSLSGALETEIAEIPSSDVEADYADRLRSGRWADKGAGRTLEGPHRSDLTVSHRPKGMAAALCSTGEQKALLVGIVLAHARLTAEMNGFPPILLLDEIAAHLDARRRAALFDMIEDLGCQSFMTGTDQALFETIRDRGKFFTVAEGKVNG
jgi:DNA replication and repair protein RecF